MRIKSVEIENFRGFQGSHDINFSYEDNSVNLVIAENEIGKTSLLNAILWSLYGKLTESSQEQESIINKDYFRICKKETRPQASVKLSLVSPENYNEFDPDVFQITRTIRYGQPSSGNIFVHLVDGITGNQKQISDPKEFINGFCPEAIANYFFFDGEGINKITNNESLLRESIRNIQGLDAAEKALSDLNIFQEKRIKEIKKLNSANEELLGIIAKIQEYTAKLKSLNDEKVSDEIYKNKLEKDKKLKQASIGNLGIDRVTELQTNISNYEKQIKEFKTSLLMWEEKDIKFIGENSLAITSHKHLDTLYKDILEKEKTSGLPSGYEEVFVKDILHSLQCICGEKFKKNDERWKKIESLLETARTNDLDNKIFSIKAAYQIYLKDIAQFNSKRSEIDSRLEHFDTELKKAEIALKTDQEHLQNTDDKKIKKVAKEIEKIDDELFSLAQKGPRRDISIKELERDLAELKRKRTKITGASQFLENDQAELDFIENTVNNLERLIEKTELEGKERITELMNEKLKRFGRGANKFAFKDSSYMPLIFDKHGIEEDTLEDAASSSKVLSGAGGVVKRDMFFATSLNTLSMERANDDTSYQIPGIICPMVADAPFSNLDASYTTMLSELLISSADQLIIFMYGSAYNDGFEEAITQPQNKDKLKSIHILHRDYIGENEGKTASEKRKKETRIKFNKKSIQTSHFNKSKETTHIVKMDIK